MGKFLQIMADAARRLAGTGAVNNAACEIDRAVRSVVELDARLGLLEPPPRRAA